MQEIERQLIPLRDHEKEFRRIFRSNPAAFRPVVRSWAEFKEIYRKTGGSKKLGEKSPGFMGELITEADLFRGDRTEVVVLPHDRYSPPFYHKLKFIKIVYALKGEFYFYSRKNGGDSRIAVSQGDFVIIPPDCDQAVFTCMEKAVTINILLKRSTFEEAFYSLLFENDRISDYFWQMLYRRGTKQALVVRCKGEGRIRECVVELCREGLGRENKAGSSLILRGYVMLLFGYALRAAPARLELLGEDGERINGEGERKLPVMIRFIREHCSSITLPDLAARYHKSESYLSRYIHRETGKTFRSLQREFRMRKAADMLEYSKCSVEEVAAAVGYAEVSCFYRNFKSFYGMTPMRYRTRREEI